MCGRFTQMLSWRELISLHRLTDKYVIRNTEARYNIAPTQTVPFVCMDDEGNQVVEDGASLGQGDAEGRDVQREDRDRRNRPRVQGRLQDAQVPHSRRRLL